MPALDVTLTLSTPKMIDVDNLSPDHLLPPAEPTREFVVNVKSTRAIIQSLVVRPAKAGCTTHKYHVIAGNRRRKSARLAGIKKVPCIVVQDSSETTEAGIILTENNARAKNILADIMAIRTLLRGGMTREEISKTWGMSASLIDARVQLYDSLIPPLREALRSGAINEGVAKAASQLDAKRQKKISAMIEKLAAEAKRVTIAQVNAVREVDVSKAIASLDEEIFKPTTTADKKEVARWQRKLKKMKWEEVDPVVLSQVIALLS